MLEKQREGKEIAMCEYIDMLEARGEARGKARGEVEGERKLLALLAKLYALGRDEDAKLIVKDEDTRKRLYEEFCITHSLAENYPLSEDLWDYFSEDYRCFLENPKLLLERARAVCIYIGADRWIMK